MNNDDVLYHTILRLSPHPVLLLDDQGIIWDCNEAFRKLFKIPKNSRSRHLRDFSTDKGLSKLLSSGKKSLQKTLTINQAQYCCLAEYIDADDFRGRLVQFTETADIGQLKESLNQERTSKEELDHVIQGSYDYIFLTDAEGNVKKINDAYTRITGYQPSEIIGENIYDLVKRGYFDRAVTTDVIETRETQTLTQTLKSGKTVLVTGSPLFSDTGEFIGVVTNGRDVTELNRLKQEVKQAEGLTQHYQKELLKFQLDTEGDYIVASQKMAEISDLIQRIARVDSTVLINGESGVGKEIVAREIHRNSMRNDRPYICVNCAAIPDNLLESELFGYEPGAFTGANRHGKMGIFQLADTGTLFLDEIGELPFYLQAKLLRVIQESEIVRIGGAKPIHIDVRLVTATNRNLWKMVTERQFREDLYYRLNVVQVRIPPLRERKEEIPVFVEYFLGMLNKKYNLTKRMNPALIQRLMQYEWQGNIRELRNALEQAYVTSSSDYISDIKLGPQQELHLSVESDTQEGLANLSLKDAMHEYESKIIKEAISTYGTTRRVARVLGVSQATVWRKAKQYGIHIDEEETMTIN